MNTMTPDEAFAAYEAVRQRLPDAGRGGACQTVDTLEDLADRFDVFLLDAFGVLNIGERAIPGAVERVASLTARGKTCLVVTNAAGYPHRALIERYHRLGFQFSEQDAVSSRATLLTALKKTEPRRWGMMATQRHGLLDLEGFDVFFLAEDSKAYDAADGFLFLGSAEWNAERQQLLETSLARCPREVWVGNPDIVAPRETGFSIEPGSYAHQLADPHGDRAPLLRQAVSQHL